MKLKKNSVRAWQMWRKMFTLLDILNKESLHTRMELKSFKIFFLFSHFYYNLRMCMFQALMHTRAYALIPRAVWILSCVLNKEIPSFVIHTLHVISQMNKNILSRRLCEGIRCSFFSLALSNEDYVRIILSHYKGKIKIHCETKTKKKKLNSRKSTIKPWRQENISPFFTFLGFRFFIFYSLNIHKLLSPYLFLPFQIQHYVSVCIHLPCFQRIKLFLLPLNL